MAVYEETIKINDEVSGPAKAASSSIAEMSTQTLGLQGELAALTGGLSLVVEAMAAVAVGFGVLVAAGAAFAISANEAQREATSLFDALGAGKVTGEELDGLMDQLRESTGLTAGSLEKLTVGFLKMGITGKEALEGLVVAAASAEALGKGGADAFTKLYRQVDIAAQTGSKLTIPYKKLQSQLVSMGLNVDDLAKQMGMSTEALTNGLKEGTIDAAKFGDALQDAVTKKGAGPLKMMANSISNIGDLVKEYLGELFEDLGDSIGPFLTEVKSLFAILSQAQPSGQALKAGIGGFFKEVFSIATKVVPMIKHFFLDMIIFGLKAYIALKPIAKSIKDIWEQNDGMGKLLAVWELLKPSLIFVGIAVGAVVLVMGALMAVSFAVGAAIWGLAAIISGFVMQAVTALADWAVSAYNAATNFITGLVKGITDGAALVTNAVTGLASSATGAFKNALGISSPSKVMMTMGGHVASGAAIGIEDGTPDVHAASQGLATATVTGASSPPSGSSSGQSGASGPITVYVQIDGAGKTALEMTQEMVSSVFESMRLASGA